MNLNNLKKKAAELKGELTALNYAFQNPKVGILPKIIIIAAVWYALSPIDLIPDFIPIIGYLDDLIIIPLLISIAIKLIPEKIMAESRRSAGDNPIKLEKKWITGVIFIMIWLFVFVLILKVIMNSFL